MNDPTGPDDPDTDPFRPPKTPTLVGCLHCGQTYESYLIEWRVETYPDGRLRGFWCCPVPGCGGCGFGFDIFPVDPDWRDPEGRLVRIDDPDDEDDLDLDDDDLDVGDVGFESGPDPEDDDVPF